MRTPMRIGKTLIVAQFLIALFVIACGSDQKSDLKIIGGEAVSPDDPIAQSAAALVSPDGKVRCTVVPISAKVFITAAHCVYGRPDYKAWSIVTGTEVHSGTAYSIHSVIVHEQFSSQELRTVDPTDAPNDIALIRTNEPVAGTIPVPIIRGLDYAADQMPLTITVAGYGRSLGSDSGSKGILRKVNVAVLDHNIKTHEFSSDDIEGRMGCHGDSGGPAFTYENGKLVLVGIVSRGHNSCVKGQTIYTDVSGFSDFIRKSLDSFGATRN
jgi:secreted trypsin-like serine protease